MWQLISDPGNSIATLRPPAPRFLVSVSLSQALMSGKKLLTQTAPRRFQDTSSVAIVFKYGSAYIASTSTAFRGSAASRGVVVRNPAGCGLGASISGT